MNRKQLLTLVAALVVLGIASLLVYRHNTSTWKPAPAAGRVLGDFDPNGVEQIVIQTGSSTLNVAKKNDKWVVPARDDYPADFTRVRDLVKALWELKPAEDEQAGPSQLGRFHLLPPGKDGEDGTLVELQNKDLKDVAALMVGKKLLKKSPQFPDQEGYPAGCYVMPAGSNPPKVSLVTETLAQVDPSPTAWLDKTFLHIDRIQSVSLVSGTNRWSVTRDSEAENEWKLTGIKPAEKLDQSKVPYFVSIFGEPAFNDVMPAHSAPPAVDSTVTVTTFDQFTYMLKFGKPAGDNLPLSIAVTANLPKERTPGAGEKPEDKKRLDDEFTAKSKELADTLAKDKTLETRIYLVPKATFDALFIPRAGLLAAPEAPAPTPASPLHPTSPPHSASPSPSASPKPLQIPYNRG